MAFIRGNIHRYMTDKWQQKFNYTELKLIISTHITIQKIMVNISSIQLKQERYTLTENSVNCSKYSIITKAFSTASY
jgi:hypothetical protein